MVESKLIHAVEYGRALKVGRRRGVTSVSIKQSHSRILAFLFSALERLHPKYLVTTRRRFGAFNEECGLVGGLCVKVFESGERDVATCLQCRGCWLAGGQTHHQARGSHWNSKLNHAAFDADNGRAVVSSVLRSSFWDA